VSDIHTLIGVSHAMFLNVGFCHSRLEKKATHTRACESLPRDLWSVNMPLSGGFGVNFCYLLTIRFRGAQIFQSDQARVILSTQKHLGVTTQNLVPGATLCPWFWRPCIILRPPQ